MMLLNLLGLVLILAIIWWFWIYSPDASKQNNQTLIIEVENGSYTPSHIILAPDTPHTLVFVRRDPSPCAETVIFPELALSATLPLGEKQPVKLPPLKPGLYQFHCQMQMYRGKLTVEENML